MKTRAAVRVLITAFSIAVSSTVWSAPHGFVMSAGVDDEAIANGYYATIDPLNQRTTQADFLEVNGFNDPVNEVVVAKGHFNDGDLQFFRVIKMVEDKRPGYEENYAFSTGNYLTEADALAEVNSVSLVNMEFSPGPNDDRITKFYIYDEGSDTRRISTIFDETNTQLYLPAACYSCHGGDDDEETASPDGYNEGSGETNSSFLAFDVRTMKFFGTSKASLEAAFKKLNQGVLQTDPTKATKKLIKGLYGGSGLPRSTQDVNYIPSSWAGEEELYSDVIVPTCLSCHTTSDSKILRLAWWKNNPKSLREVIFHERLMPDSLPAYNRFWNETNQHEIVLDALNRFEAP